MKIVIPGGTGQVGTALAQHFARAGHQVVILTRTPPPGGSRAIRVLAWDGKTLGAWSKEFDDADVVINLAGRTVNCRYTEENLKQMMDSRVDSTRVVGQAIARAAKPPAVWLQMSTATIYAHRFDAANDEATGILGGSEPDAPAYWARSIDIAKAWERTQEEADTPNTRKVALRTAMVMGPGRDGIFDVLSGLARSGLGGAIAGGMQYISWIHEDDFLRAIDYLLLHAELTGPVNLAAPNPLPQGEFMQILRSAVGQPLGLPATKWMAEIGAFFMRSDVELIMKSRRVVPGRLLASGFEFLYSEWSVACAKLWSARTAQ
jgi:uncharacterized protein